MSEEPMAVIPSFSVEVEARPAGSDEAARRLAAFAAEQGVSAGVKDRLAAVAHRVVTGLAGADGGSDRIVIEADVDRSDLQVVFTRELASRESVSETRTRVAGVAASCDGFSTQHAGATGLEVWVCFSLA